MTDSSHRPSRLLKLAAFTAPWVLGLVLAAWLLFGIAWGALHGWIVPRIEEFRPRIEAELGKALGVPVRIGAISAQSSGLVPSFELRDVTLLDAQGREAMRLTRIVALLSPRSLLRLSFDQIYVERPELDIRRTADGHILIAGLDMSRGSDNQGQSADWVFSQAEVVLRGGTIRWTDEKRAAPTLALSDVDLVIRNGTRRHALRFDATPPADWGDRFSLRALMRQPLLNVHKGDWREWTGAVFADFPRVDVSQLRRYVDAGATAGVEVWSGRGAVRLWADVQQAEMTGGTADLALTDLNAKLGADLEPLGLQAIQGRLSGRKLAGGMEFGTEDLQFATDQGQRWPGGNVFMSFMRGESRVPGQGVFRADRLDLAALAQVANRLPLDEATRQKLVNFAPKGLMEKVDASWSGPPETPTKYQVKGRIVGLELAAGKVLPMAAPTPAQPHPHHPTGRPGVRGADVDFELTQAGGQLSVSLQNGALEFPGVFEEPVVPIDQLAGAIKWQRDGEKLSVQVPAMRFGNADAQGELQAQWRTSEGAQSTRGRYPGVLDLSGSLSRGAGNRVHRYLPLAVPDSARHYVRDAVQKGRATSVRFRVKGDLHDFPYLNPKLGEFNITAQVVEADYAYVPASIQPPNSPPWPALTQAAATLVFDRNSMLINNVTGKLVGLPGFDVTQGQAQIDNYAQSVVVVAADGRGPLAEMLGMVASSPLAAMTNHALAQTSATGSADLKLQLNLPLANMAQSRVQGSVTLAGNDVQIIPEAPPLTRARGTVQFSETGFSLVGMQARALGGEVRAEGGTRVGAGPLDTTVQIRAQGVASAEGLRAAREFGPVARLAQHATGTAPYTLVLGIRRGVPEINVTSTLQGLAVNLPAPLAKAADATLPLRVENVLLPLAGAAGQAAATSSTTTATTATTSTNATSAATSPAAAHPTHDQWTVELGKLASAVFVRDISGTSPKVLRGTIALGLAANESSPMPEEGIAANVQLQSLQVDAWETAFAGIAEPAAPTAPTAPGPRAASAASASNTSYLPDRFALRAGDLTVGGRKLHNVVLGGSRDGQTWRANVDAKELGGYVEYRQPAGAGPGRVFARLSHLTIDAGADTDVEHLLDEQTDSVPALDIVVEDFDLRGKKLGRIEVDAVNRGGGAVAREGGVREWRLNKLNLTMPEASFTASGNWAAVNAQYTPPGGPRPPRTTAEPRRTVMNFKLDIHDAGALLGRFNMKDVFRRGKGHMEGQVAWVGSPLALDYPSLAGQLNINVENGQFLKADPGLAKLLGVLSLQSLPRRLSLDFRDVFSEGFAFDFIRGDVRIDQGIAMTNNLQMKGVSAAVLMDGRADIARETQDIKVVVVPEINAGTASLVATVINPAIGLGTFLAQMFLRRPLMEAATQQFHLDGTWADPRIARVARDKTSATDESKTEALAPAKPGATP